MTKKCFVVSSIGNEGSDVRIHSDNVLEFILKPVCEENDITLIRADEITTTSLITEDIYNHLNNDDLSIVDITYLNPNVFLELGYRIAKNKPYIIIKDKDVKEKYPFDISGIRVLEYSIKLENMNSSKKLLDKFLKNVDYSKNDTITLIEPDETTIGLNAKRVNGQIAIYPTKFKKS